MKTSLLLALAACIPINRTRHVERMCADPNYAYETGYNDGVGRRRLDTSWVEETCAPPVREGVRDSYQRGYKSGIDHAPLVIRGGVSASAPTCRFSSDCSEGQSCRADASGTNACMGSGYAGDPCWFSSDCVSDSCDASAKTCR